MDAEVEALVVINWSVPITRVLWRGLRQTSLFYKYSHCHLRGLSGYSTPVGEMRTHMLHFEPEKEQLMRAFVLERLNMLEPAVGVSGVYSRSKRMAPSNTNPDNSLEVRAFAEGASTSGQKYPSRSFFCSFCQREFRNAQALGGHMNVHRRERALASQLLQLRNHGNELEEPPSNNPPVTRDSQDVITQASNMLGDFCAGSSSSSSSPPSQESISLANSLLYSVRNMPRLDSVDLELRLGQTPEI